MIGQQLAVFPDCRRCASFLVGPAGLCAACARGRIEPVAADACGVCSQRLAGRGQCPNELCRSAHRRIRRIHAIGYQSGPLRRAINDFKYRGARDLAVTFGRLLLGWLDATLAHDPPDLIVANPSFIGPGGQLFAHTEAVLDAAAAEAARRPATAAQRWMFDTATPRAVVKMAATLRSADEQAWSKQAAAADLRLALRIPDPVRTAGRSILVYDDVCTTGRQLDAVAACLLDRGGAALVDGLVLARAPWRGSRAGS